MPPQPAFVLHQWDWSESSLILELFGRDSGRMVAVAKGAKRPYSQLRPVLMPFQQLVVSLSRPSERTATPAAGGVGAEAGDIVTLRSAEYAGGGTVLPPERLMAGFYLNELLLKLLARGDPHPDLFDLYADALKAMAADPGEPPLRAFELLLLREIGLLPELDRDTATQRPVQPGGDYRLDAALGLVVNEAGGVAGLPGALVGALEQGLRHARDALHARRERAADEEARAVLEHDVDRRLARPDRPSETAAANARSPASAIASAVGAAQAGRATGFDPGARLRAACALAPGPLRQQLRPLLHYHLGVPALRTRQLMLAVRRLSDPPAPSDHESARRP